MRSSHWRATSADVLVVQEMTPGRPRRMSSAGLDATFPHRIIDPRDRRSGIGVWSRYPIVESARIDGYQLPMLMARIQVPGVRFATDRACGAPRRPVGAAAALLPRRPGPLPGHIARRIPRCGRGRGDRGGRPQLHLSTCSRSGKLLDEGYRDAGEQAGAGLTRTYPNRPWRRPMIGIDHVLVYNCTASSAGTVVVPGSDHRGLATTIEVPADPTASYPV